MIYEIPLGYALLDSSASAAGTTQNTATQLQGITSIVTSGSANSGVMILAMPKITQMVYNATTNTINVWPQLGMALAPAATNTAVTLAPGRTIGVVVADATHAYILFNSSSFF